MKEFNDTVNLAQNFVTHSLYISHTHIHIYITYHYIYTYHILYIYHIYIEIYIYTHKFFLMEICSKKNLKNFRTPVCGEHKTIAVIQWLYLSVKLCCMHIATKKEIQRAIHNFSLSFMSTERLQS